MSVELNAAFSEMVAHFGTEQIHMTEIREKFPKYVGLVYKNAAKTGRRGVWDLSNVVNFAKKENDAVAMPATVVNAFGAESATVPSKDPNYVSWGCYKIVRKALSSKMFLPIYITGDSGNGKTLGVEQACHAEKRPLIAVNVTNETAEEDLIGNFSLSNGNMTWNDGPAIRAMKQGAVLLLDEIDQATSKILCLQTILQNYEYHIKKTGETVRAAPGFTVVATANTKGNGESADRFIGANILNEAFLERFAVIVEQEYPTEAIEKKILSKHNSDEKIISRLVTWANGVRASFNAGAISSPITTRRLVQICKNMAVFGDEVDAVTYAVNRFSAQERDNLVSLYKALMVDAPAAPEPAEEVVAEGPTWIPF